MRSSMLRRSCERSLRIALRIERARHLRVLAHLLGQRLQELVERRAQLIHQLLDLFVGGAALQRLAQRVLRGAQAASRRRRCCRPRCCTAIAHSRATTSRSASSLLARVELPVDRAQAEIDVGLRRESLRRDRERVERGQHAVLGVGVERELAALLDQRARQRLGERPLRQPHLVRRANGPRCRPRRGRPASCVTSTPAHGCSVRSLVVWPTPLRVRACGSTSGKFGRARRAGAAAWPARRRRTAALRSKVACASTTP